MPSGYTAKLYEGEQSFEDFVLNAARGMGALITMRDEPTDAPVPDRFEPSDYYVEKLRDARAALTEHLGRTDTDHDAVRLSEHERAVQRAQKSREDNTAKRRRYEAMLAQVEDWEPPSPDHVGLKDFMIEQLSNSIDFDTNYEIPDPELLPLTDWKQQRKYQLQRDVNYYGEELRKETDRARERSAWVQQLKRSLGLEVKA